MLSEIAADHKSESTHERRFAGKAPQKCNRKRSGQKSGQNLRSQSGLDDLQAVQGIARPMNKQRVTKLDDYRGEMGKNRKNG